MTSSDENSEDSDWDDDGSADPDPDQSQELGEGGGDGGSDNGDISNNGSEGGNGATFGDAHTAPSSGEEEDDSDVPSAPFVYPQPNNNNDEDDEDFEDEVPLVAKEDEEEEGAGEEQPRNVAHDPMIKPLLIFIVVASLLAIIIFPILFKVVLPNHTASDDKNQETKAPTPGPTATAPPTPFQWVLDLPDAWKTRIQADPTSSTAQAYQWLADDPNLYSIPMERLGQRFALAGLYYAADGANWTRSSNWLSYWGSECLWEGVICDTSGTLPNAPGTIAPTTTAPVGNTTVPPPTAAPSTNATTNTSNIFEQAARYLRRSLQVNTTPSVTTTTTAAESFDRVQFLELSDNNLKGTVPAEFSLLTDLQFLDLKDNSLTGNFPPLLFDSLVNLMEFNVRNNNGLRGMLPATIVKWSNLALFDVSQNQQWTGRVPSELGLLTALNGLDLSHNQFTGIVPTQLSQLGLLQRLSLRGNKFNFTLPPAYGNMGSLLYLDMGQNSFVGRIPPGWESLSLLTTLLLDNNNLSGAVPPQIGPAYNQLNVLNIANNPQLSGIIPQQVCFIETLNFTCLANPGLLCGCGCNCGSGSMLPGDLSTPGPDVVNGTIVPAANSTLPPNLGTAGPTRIETVAPGLGTADPTRIETVAPTGTSTIAAAAP